MATSRHALLLAALCCAALVGCPKVKDVKGTVYSVTETNFGPLGSKATARSANPIKQGEQLPENSQVRVEPGSSITIEFSEDCVRTFGPGTHVLSKCDDDDDDDQDQDDDQDRDKDQEQNEDQDLDTDSTDTSTQASGTSGQTGLVTSSTLTTTGIIAGTVLIGVGINEAINDDDDDDVPPLSP